MKLFKLKIGFLTMACASMFLVSCGGDNSAESKELEEQKSTEQVILDSLSTGKEYFQNTLDYFFGQSWITFEGGTVEFTVRSKDGWGNTIDNKDVMGKYTVINNNGSYSIESDFGRESVNIQYLTGGTKPKRREVDYPLPKILKVEFDSLNNVIIKNWIIVKPKVE
jgi:hypothetical protein